ncbi:MAG TPA: hypothetical protein VHE59_21835 [Mucilaginibacter sp.]|nr:hypothetical protein [Mucilaginibacter sp.]
MSQKIKYLTLLAIAFIQFCTGCNKFIFIPGGTVIKGEDHQYYLNDSIKLTINVWGDFNIYNRKLKKGVRVDKIYTGDKRILADLNIKSGQTKLLFSAVPTVEPYYHFVAFIREARPENMKLYKPKYDKDTLLYYYRILTISKVEIAETLIPFHRKYIEFLYYNHIPNDCPYCDVDDMSLRNSRQLQKGGEFYQVLNSYSNPLSSEPVIFNIPASKVLKNKTGLVRAYNINAEQNSKALISFKFLEPNTGRIELNLPPGQYLIQYSDLNHKLIWDQHYLKN